MRQPLPSPNGATLSIGIILRSPNGAAVNSPGCQPLVPCANHYPAPTGRHSQSESFSEVPTGRQSIARGVNPWYDAATITQPQRGDTLNRNHSPKSQRGGSQ